MKHTHGRRLLALTALIALALALPTFSLAGAAISASGDLGDAPDSSNHVGVAMTAYTGGPAARFPTVYDIATGAPEGPLHLNPTANGWLGQAVSVETDADLLPDADGVRNIDPAINTNNRDGLDDGVPPASPTINLPTCGATQFRYLITGVAAPPAPTNYVNVWIDYNRDGDWEDRFSCTTPTGGSIPVMEWAVQNQVVNVAPGTVAWSTPVFNSLHATASTDHWMRISIAEQTAPINPLISRADGRGPPAAYKYGETEDYLLRLSSGTSYKPT